MPEENAHLVDENTVSLRAWDREKSPALEAALTTVRSAVSESISDQTWNSFHNGILYNPSLRQQIERAYSSGRERIKWWYLPVKLEIELWIYWLWDENSEAIVTMIYQTLDPLLRTYHPQIVGFPRENKNFKVDRIPNTTSVTVNITVLLK